VIDALRAEWIKFSTLVSNWVMVVIAAAFPLVIVLLTGLLADRPWTSAEYAELITGTAVVSALVLGTLGVLAITADYGHNTIRPTFAALPDRWRALLAKPIVQVAVSAAVVAAVVVVSWGVGTALLEGEQSLGASGVSAALVGIVLLAVGLTILGYGLGLLVRNTPLAICILLLWPLVVEGILAGLLSVAGWEGLHRWLPYQAAFNMIVADTADDDQLGRVGGGAWFFLWVFVVTAFGLFSAKRRDA
jgi:ABC-2 type transport system permease protein